MTHRMCVCGNLAAGFLLAATLASKAALLTDTVTATNWVHQTSTSTGTNYFMRGGIGVSP
jgi:hypothetical protein